MSNFDSKTSWFGLCNICNSGFPLTAIFIHWNCSSYAHGIIYKKKKISLFTHPFNPLLLVDTATWPRRRKKNIFNSSFSFTWEAVKSLLYNTAKEQGIITRDPKQHSPRQGKDLQLSGWAEEPFCLSTAPLRAQPCQDTLPSHSSCPWVDERGTGAEPFALLSFGASQGQHRRRRCRSATAWKCPPKGEQTHWQLELVWPQM